jgi:hypothetical protein
MAHFVGDGCRPEHLESSEDVYPYPGPAGALQQPGPEDAEGPVMHDLLITDLRQRFHAARFRLEVEEDVRSRLEFGLRKYGKPLRAHNGRNPLLDAYQESLDQVVYLIQAMVELPVCGPADALRLARFADMYDRALVLAFELREELSG